MGSLYLAPMEEVTGHVYRNVMSRFFCGADKYFTPFITPTEKRVLRTRDKREIDLTNNAGKLVVPQILTNDAGQFWYLADYLYDEGYKELNINCGCPSKTVCAKNKGSGILRDSVLLDQFLDGVFTRNSNNIKISVKTRLGFYECEEMQELLKIYNQYPISELIIHLRTGVEMYKGVAKGEWYEYCLNNSQIPLCYNGDICSAEDYAKVISRFGNKTSVMIGRGAICKPDIFAVINKKTPATKADYFEFAMELYRAYSDEFGEKDAVFKLKEVWSYLKINFDDFDKTLKKIQKAKTKEAYLEALYEYKECKMTNDKISGRSEK